ncbi:hypothetical protein [Streptomyces bobili]|uniref:hypothetical protein n=1 Tax=Streptomyces bobili TaxID=67280 RepID=UPI0037AA2316
MRNGGEAREADADGNDTVDGHGELRRETGQSADPDPAPPTLLGRLKKHRLLASAVSLALVATGVAVPLALAGQDDGPPCQEIPATTRALAENPAAATRALDPGDDLNRLDAVRRLLAHEHPCSDGGKALGAVVDAATRATGPETPHTLAQARAAFGAAAALNDVELPDGMAPGVARMLAQYVVDQHRYLGSDDEAVLPAVPAESTRPNEKGWTTYGRFLAPGEAHADFEHARPYTRDKGDPRGLIAELAKDPQAFAILYAAERAWFAYYLERLDGQGTDPAYQPKPTKYYPSPRTTWIHYDLEHMADRIGVLMAYRSLYARNGTIPDLTAFDAAVRRHTPGVYLADERQLTSRPPMASIAARKPSGRADENLMDARHQLDTVLGAWAAARRIPAARAASLRQIIDNRYVWVLQTTR